MIDKSAGQTVRQCFTSGRLLGTLQAQLDALVRELDHFRARGELDHFRARGKEIPMATMTVVEQKLRAILQDIIITVQQDVPDMSNELREAIAHAKQLLAETAPQ